MRQRERHDQGGDAFEAALLEERPEISREFAAELDAWAAEGFPPRRGRPAARRACDRLRARMPRFGSMGFLAPAGDRRRRADRARRRDQLARRDRAATTAARSPSARPGRPSSATAAAPQSGASGGATLEESAADDAIEPALGDQHDRRPLPAPDPPDRRAAQARRGAHPGEDRLHHPLGRPRRGGRGRRRRRRGDRALRRHRRRVERQHLRRPRPRDLRPAHPDPEPPGLPGRPLRPGERQRPQRGHPRHHGPLRQRRGALRRRQGRGRLPGLPARRGRLARGDGRDQGRPRARPAPPWPPSAPSSPS